MTKGAQGDFADQNGRSCNLQGASGPKKCSSADRLSCLDRDPADPCATGHETPAPWKKEKKQFGLVSHYKFDHVIRACFHCPWEHCDIMTFSSLLNEK